MRSPFDFVLAIVIIAIGYQMFKTYMEHRNQARTSPEAGEADALRRRIDELEERIRVLERIVTDETSSLRQQFRDL